MSNEQPNDEKEHSFLEAKDDADLLIVWCPECNKMISNEYKRCPQCKALVDEEWRAEFEVVKKLEKDLNGLIKGGYNDRALEIAQIIRDIGEKIGDKFLVEEQEALIDKISKELGGVEELEKVVENCKKLTLIFDKLVSMGKIIEAHDLVEEFKRVHERKLNEINNFMVVKELFSKDEEILMDLLNQQTKIEAELQDLEQSIKNDLNNEDFDVADEKWKIANDLINKIFDETIVEYWENLEYDYVGIKERNKEQSKIKKKLAKLEEKISQDIDNNDFEAIDGVWPAVNRMLEKVKDEEIKEKWKVIEEDYKTLKETIEEQFEILERLDKYEEQIRKAIDERDYHHGDNIWIKAGKLVVNSFDEGLKKRWKEFKMDYEKKKRSTRFKKKPNA